MEGARKSDLRTGVVSTDCKLQLKIEDDEDQVRKKKQSKTQPPVVVHHGQMVRSSAKSIDEVVAGLFSNIGNNHKLRRVSQKMVNKKHIGEFLVALFSTSNTFKVLDKISKIRAKQSLGVRPPLLIVLPS